MISSRTTSAEPALDELWDPDAVAVLARELAAIAASELTRSAGAVRDPQFLAHMKAVLRQRFLPADIPAVVGQIAGASLHLCHPRFMAQQVAAPLPAAALVECVVAALNQSVAVWDMSPAATIIDRDVLRGLIRAFGFPRSADGSLVPGGSYANLTALLAARAALAPRAWRTATVERLKAKGVEFTLPVSDQGWGLLTQIRLPGGEVLGLYEPRHPTAIRMEVAGTKPS